MSAPPSVCGRAGGHGEGIPWSPAGGIWPRYRRYRRLASEILGSRRIIVVSHIAPTDAPESYDQGIGRFLCSSSRPLPYFVAEDTLGSTVPKQVARAMECTPSCLLSPTRMHWRIGRIVNVGGVGRVGPGGGGARPPHLSPSAPGEQSCKN